MSRVRQEIASVIFQADARKANASMEALQEKANSLNDAITGVKQQIEALGNVAPDHQGLISYQQQLRKLNSDLKDVQKTMSDYMRGVKAADQLWQSYMRGDIEGLSLKAIKAGQNGLRKRMENLSPGNPDDQKTLRAYEEVIKEADLVVNKFKTDAAETIQILRDGGTVSEQAMKKARDGVKSLMETVEEGTQEYRQFSQQYEYLAAKTIEFTEAQRRAKGEIVDANDARRAAARLTKEGAEAAAREREAQDAVITAQQKEIEQTRALRQEKEKEIEQTNSQMATNMRLADAAMAERRQMEDDYQASLGAISAEKRQQAQQQAQAAHDEADQMRANAQIAQQTAQQKRTAYEQETQTVTQLDGEVKKLTEDLKAMSAEPVKPKVDSSDVDGLNQKLEELQGSLERVQQMKSTAQEKIASAKEILGDTDKPWNNERVKKALEEDRITQEQNIEKLNAKWDEYWEKQEKNAREFAAVLNKAAIDDVDWDEFYTHVTGPNAEMAKSWYRVQLRNMRGVEYWGEDSDNYKELVSLRASKKLGSASDGMLEELKLLEALKRKWDEYQKALNKAREDSPKYDAAYTELDNARTEIIQQERLLEAYTEHERQLKEQISETEKLTQAQQQSATTSDELQRKQTELAAKTDELAQAKQRQAKAQGEMNTAEQQAAKAQDDANQKQVEAVQLSEKAAQAEREAATEQERHNEVLQRQDEKIAKLQNEYDALDDTLRKQEGELTAYDQKVAQSEQAIAEAERKKAQARELSAKDMRDAIAALRERNDAIGEANPEWEKNERLIAQYNKRLEEMKQRSDAIRREPVEQMMTQRMEDLSNLSRDALAETKRFWQSMYDGAEKNDPKLAEIEKRLKDINAEEQKRDKGQLQKDARLIKTADLSTVSEQELQASIRAAKQLVQAMDPADEKYKELVADIIRAEEHVEKFGLAGETSTQKQAQQLQQMTDRMASLGNLSDAALQETKKFWEAQVAGTEKSNTELAAYEARLKAVKDEEKERARVANEQKSWIVQRGTLENFSETEIRESINAAKEFQAQMKSSSPEAQKLAEAIARAESHIEKYGIAAKRAAQRQKESEDMMRKQLSLMSEDFIQGRGLPSESILKAQHSYWLKLIEDPKNAGKNLQEYRDRLQEVKDLQDKLVQVKGETAFEWFRNGSYQNSSADQTKRLADDLKTWRDTLGANDSRLEAIDGYLQKVGKSAKKAAEDVMSLDDALELAAKAGENYYLQNNKEGFVASPEQIQKATKAINERRDAVIKEIQAKKQLNQATDQEEAELADLTKKLRDLKFEQDNVNMSQEKMRMLMKQPAQAVSLDELRAAIKRADGELRRMEGSLGKNSKEYKAFAEQVKAAKNTLKDMEGAAKASASAWEKAVSRLKTYVGLYMGFNILWQKMVGTIGDLHELSDRMGEVGKTTQMASGEIDLLTDNLKKIDTRTPVTELLSLSAAAGQLGLKSREDVEGFTEAANKMLVALPEMGRDGATQMMKVALATGEVERIRKQMEEGMIEGSSATAVAMEKIASTIDQLRANSAAAAPQITDFVKRVGAVGAQSGITIDQVAALGSTVDALGMRVEMSATALSRMIPAIKNNAFEVAKAIGMAPEALRHMFDEAGGGMNAMLAIFQHIKDSGMNADDIEKMMGMGGMQDIMKDLNQQGARAGIVFAGLSQNVDVLREHLGIAHDAYEENIAIQQEYDRMNETTAAKWERLANKVEEMFVGSGTQSALGKIYDMLTWIVDLITGPLNTAFLSATGAVLAIKSGLTEIPSAVGNVFDYLKDSAAKASEALEKAANATSEISEAAEGVEEAGDAVGEISDALGDAKEAGEQAGEAMESATGAIEGMTGATKVSIFSVKGLKAAWKGLDTTMKANIIVAVIALLYTLGKAIYNVVTEIGKNNKAVAEANAMIQVAIDRFEGYWQKLKDTATALDQAREKTKKLKEGSEELTKATVEVTKADNAHRAAIADMNSIYGKYLGFMLTEQNYALLNAAAHDKVTAAIRREMLAKQQQAAIDQVTQENTENLKTGLANLTEELREDGRLNTEQAAQAKRAVQQFMRENIKFSAGGDATISNEAYKYLQSKGANRGKLKGLSVDEFAAAWFYEYLEDNFHLDKASLADITGVFPQGGGYRNTNKLGRNFRGDYASAYSNYMQEIVETQDVFAGETADAEKKDRDATQKLVKKLQQDAKNAQAKILNKSASQQERNQAYEQLANALEGLDTNIDQLNPVSDKTLIEGAKQLADNIAKTVDSGKLTRARSNARSIFARATNGSNVETQLESLDPEKNIWGDRLPAESTDWKNMTAEQLVNRRKQMKDFVNAIQTDTDVQSVLKEDAALKKAIEAGMSSDMRTVIEWYNTERLKIQDELHARHLTNTGDWMDPKKERGAKKQFRDEMDAYLHELDAYYTERKTRIEEAGTDEGLTEAEIRNRTLANEMEWRQRRAELQKLYSRKSAEVTREEQEAVFAIIAERTGDTERFVEQTIQKTNRFVDSIEKSGDKGAAIVHRWMSGVELETERDYLKQQQALTKQMKAIQDIIDRERPFNGITKQLRENLATMDILTGDMRKRYQELLKSGTDEEKKRFNEEQAREEVRRTAFMLGEAEQAYSTTIDRVMADMREKGMTAWADWLQIHPEQQEGLMAQLRSTYDQIQDAIKKEASQLKKQAEIMWNNILVPGGDGQTTLKQMMDRTVAQLGIDEGRVSRANSLIGAGVASDRVADRLAIKQMQLQLTMQEHYYNLMKKQGRAHVDMLNQQADAAERRGDAEEATRKRLDAQHAEMALNLATAKEETELAKQREEIIARTEESQNRLYTELKEWADLLTSSIQGVFEASHAGDAEYYNERAKLDLTGKGGPGAGTYVVIDDAGTDDARAHYEYLDERQALEREHEIERENAQAEAWKKLWDDINMKMSDQITDWLNASLQNQSIDANTQAVLANTQAIYASMGHGTGSTGDGITRNAEGFAVDQNGQMISPIAPTDVEQPEQPRSYWPLTSDEVDTIKSNISDITQHQTDVTIAGHQAVNDALAEMPNISKPASEMTEEEMEAGIAKEEQMAAAKIEADNKVTENKKKNDAERARSEKQTDQQMQQSAQSTFGKMAAAANLYGIAYQTMSNDNMDMTQKFQMFALQAAGQTAIGMLTTNMLATDAQGKVELPGILGKAASQLGPIAGPIAFAAMTALLGGLMAVAMSSVTKSKSQIAQVTGASVGAGRLATGMLTYKEGNVDAFTDPSSLTPGRSYNVDGADGKTYRAKYTGTNPRTHLTNGPEFHLAGEAGREMIIDAGTTRQITMNENEIWRAIQTLSSGGRLSHYGSRRSGMRVFAEGNVDDFADYEEVTDGAGLGFDPAALQASLDRNSDVQEALLERLQHPLTVAGTGSNGVVAMYDKLKKEAQRQGVKYI